MFFFKVGMNIWNFDKCLFHVVNEDILMVVAHQNYKSGNYKQALEYSYAVYERNPQRTDNLLLLGAVYYQVVSFFCCKLDVGE